ncbi:MAG: branched-chain amino acid ABC transporter permease [Kiloniellales bacterium]|nr:branched-chain amino acid ABC transporter permease [Kiloniellales bacterium]
MTMQRITVTPLAWLIIGAVSLGLAYFVVYPIHVLQILCFMVFAAAFNLLIGHAGVLSLGHAAFFGSGAYLAGILMKTGSTTPELALLAATGATLVLGLLMGAIAIRRQGIYFAMITLALAQLVYFIAFQSPATGGDDGLQGIPRGAVLGRFSLESNGAIYLFVSAISLLSLWAIHRIGCSPFGSLLRAIRQNEDRAISLGYATRRYRLAAFVISAGFAGLAGGMKALVLQLASLTDISFFISGEVVLIVLLGGIGVFAGPLVGAALLIGFQLVFVSSPVPVPFVLGIVFVICVLAFPRGIVGEIVARLPAQSPSSNSPAGQEHERPKEEREHSW